MNIPTSIPSEYSSVDLDGDTRTQPLWLTDAGRVCTLTPDVIAVLPLDLLRIEYAWYRDRSAPSTADLRMEGMLARRIRELDAATAGLEAELAEAKAVYAQVLGALQSYNESIEYGDGRFSRAQQARHDRLTRKLDAAQQRVWVAEGALKAKTAAAVA